jgi:hypothetical protein
MTGRGRPEGGATLIIERVAAGRVAARITGRGLGAGTIGTSSLSVSRSALASLEGMRNKLCFCCK